MILRLRSRKSNQNTREMLLFFEVLAPLFA
jgi:hypothetical protein